MRIPMRLALIIGFMLAGIVLAACNSPNIAVNPAPETLSPSSKLFKVDSLTLNPAEVNAGVQTLITALVTNTGSKDDAYIADVRIDNLSKVSAPTFLGSKKLTILAGETQILSIFTSIKNPGTYKVTWGEASKELVVRAAPLQQPGEPQINAQPFTAIPAPDFTAVDVVTGETVSLNQYIGKTVLLNFVNYGCNTSLNDTVSSQLMVIKQVWEERGDFVPISVFCGCCPPDVLRKFAWQNGFDWPWILDTDYTIGEKYADYLSEFSYPTLVFIDKDQVITEVSGFADVSTLNKELEKIIPLQTSDNQQIK